MYAFLAGMVAARFWRGILWATGWFVVALLPAAYPQWGTAALLGFAVFAVLIRKRRLTRIAQRLEWDRQARFADMQLQAELNARAQHEWSQQTRYAEMQIQAQLNAQALFDEHTRRTGALPVQQDQVRGW